MENHETTSNVVRCARHKSVTAFNQPGQQSDGQLNNSHTGRSTFNTVDNNFLADNNKYYIKKKNYNIIYIPIWAIPTKICIQNRFSYKAFVII